MKKKLLSIVLCVAMVMSMATGCSKASTQTSGDNDKLVVGFAQIGQESGWRDAETASIQFYAGQKIDSIELKFADAQQKQENQIKAIKSFIEMGVDVIGLAPVVETGWDAVFTEAKEAGIPIVLVDRMADVDEKLYSTFIGSDFILEGKNAAIEMATLLGGKGKIVELEGTVGASAANDRKKGFDDEMAASYPDIQILESQTGDFTRAKGKEVMESFLKTYGDQINGVYAHNDDMMLGAIEAIKEAGLKPGVDVKAVSIDGVKGIFEAMAAGEANVTVECNPLLGPQFFEVCEKLKAGETVDKWIKSDEGIYRQDTAATDLPTRKY
ncbi:MAG: periplasmic binding protein/LacI transcriptional regulator [Herbinix sp.]|jgi:simple sugar transport system substrate-binding protein|nr:periplasmic binding protein/LacI transcriptional regulator [Herbinix sp.]